MPAEMTVSNALQRVVSLIIRPPSRRSKAEMDVLLPWLKNRTDVLKQLDNDILLTLFKHSSYWRAAENDVIIRQGEKGDCFYIILSGRASLYIDTIKSGEELQTRPDPEQPADPDVEDSVEGGALNMADRSPLGKFIINFDAGKSFGEIALMTDDAIRNASIVADTATDLLVINRNLFNGTLKAKQEAEYQQRKLFVRKYGLFRGWSSKFRRLCEMSLRKETFAFDSTLVKQGDPVIGLHFILRGQGRVVMDPSMHRAQYPKLFDSANSNHGPKDNIRNFPRREYAPKDTCQREQIRVRRRQGYAAAEQRLATKSVTLCYVDESEVIGDTELILGLDTYSHSIVCTAKTEVFILDTKNIERLVYKKNMHTMDMLRQIVDDKVRSRACMRVGSQVELYHHLVDKVDELRPKVPTSMRTKFDDEDAKSKSIMEVAHDRDVMMNQLSKMFIQKKVPFIEPSVPGSLYFLAKSAERAHRRALMKNLQPRKNRSGVSTGEVRLQRARRGARRQARSRRELERLTLGTDHQEMKQLKNNDHAVNRFLSATSAVGRASPTSPIDHSHVSPFFVTEPPTDFTEVDGDQIQLGYQDIANGDLKDVVVEMSEKQHAANASRAKIICSMIEKKQRKQPSPLQQLTRPKSVPAPNHYIDEDDEKEDESFDWETSDSALRNLEGRLRSFHAKYDRPSSGKKNTTHIAELKRFSIQGPDDVPIPGGTVYIRQKPCDYTSGISSNSPHHRHVRRFMVPKDAYRVAVRSTRALDGTRTQSAAATGPGAQRRSSLSNEHSSRGLAARVRSAPVSRSRRVNAYS